MIALPPETPTNKSTKRDLREEMILQLMRDNGHSREEAELAIDSFW